jgi:hypothetical protein
MTKRLRQSVVVQGLEARAADQLQQALWEAILPEPCQMLPAELAAVGDRLNDPMFLLPPSLPYAAPGA